MTNFIIDLLEMIYFQLSRSIITNILGVLFVITYFALSQPILDFVLSIFYIFCTTKLKYLTNLPKILKYLSGLK